MADRAAIAAFTMSLLGAAYQMVAYGLAYLVDNRYNYNYYFGMSGVGIKMAAVVVLGETSHHRESRAPNRPACQEIIRERGFATVENMIIQWSPRFFFVFRGRQPAPADVIVTLT